MPSSATVGLGAIIMDYYGDLDSETRNINRATRVETILNLSEARGNISDPFTAAYNRQQEANLPVRTLTDGTQVDPINVDPNQLEQTLRNVLNLSEQAFKDAEKSHYLISRPFVKNYLSPGIRVTFRNLGIQVSINSLGDLIIEQQLT